MLRPRGEGGRGRPRPPQSLWNHGCCDADSKSSASHPCPASISLESRVLRHQPVIEGAALGHRLNLFGITGAATFRHRGQQGAGVPPQSLWNHGCCDPVGGRVWCRSGPASISLESRVLRHVILADSGRFFSPPQSLWNHGCCDVGHLTKCEAGVSRLNLFGITGAATREDFVCYSSHKPPQSLWNHGCCDGMRSQRL